MFLIKGVKNFRLSFIAIYLCGLAARILLYFVFLVATALINLIPSEDNDNALIFFRKMVVIKIIICVFYTVLKIYVFITIDYEPALLVRQEQSARNTYVKKGGSNCDTSCPNTTM
ncbi:hypothetical protein ANCCAN_20086 [Ancylostoma caninum]|uniref:Uncharacterized protein n=1 Tax=Ancylostoma caninum TaxID=29170 RepID=A0A368FTE2_ANCCA|nr:hypothetical protein ANCCAN_20086 [Ancylostoma caninum]